MLYRSDRQGNPISALGFGCMRFTRSGSSIDVEKAEREILRAVDLGVNYFDTAYLYPGNEAALGTIVERNGLRSRVRITTKLPQYLVRTAAQFDTFFNTELKRLRTDHVDYYLMHMLTDFSSWENLKALGIEEWIRRQKSSGRIGQIGFSFHGNTETFLHILNDYDWDLCQIQYNYMDENIQAGRAGLEAAADKGVPVIIMEPLHGGRLVTALPKRTKEAIRRAGKTPAELGLTWLWDQPGVTCVLSGMNSIRMVDENCRIASSSPPGCLSESDRTLIAAVKKDIEATLRVPCTGCRYCMPCPHGVDIPAIFRCYNAMYMDGKSIGRTDFQRTVTLTKDPGFATRCVRCGLCETRCPQSIPIRTELRKADRALRPIPWRIAGAAMRRFMTR